MLYKSCQLTLLLLNCILYFVHIKGTWLLDYSNQFLKLVELK